MWELLPGSAGSAVHWSLRDQARVGNHCPVLPVAVTEAMRTQKGSALAIKCPKWHLTLLTPHWQELIWPQPIPEKAGRATLPCTQAGGTKNHDGWGKGPGVS